MESARTAARGRGQITAVRAGLIRLSAVKAVRPLDGLHEIAGTSRLRRCALACFRDASSGKLFTRTIAEAMLLIEGAALHNLVLAVIWNSRHAVA